MSVWLPRHLSVSSVELYARCPAMWQARYVRKLVLPTTVPMAWGTAFHKALEAGHNGRDPEAAWVRAWNAGREQLGASFVPGKAHGLTLLEEYERRGLSIRCPAEVQFRLALPGGRVPVPILGYIDANAPNELREYKTSAGGWWTETKAQLAHQTHVYGWAHQRLYRHRKPVRYVIFGTRFPTLEEWVVEPSPDGLRLFELLAEKVWEGIEAERFPACGECLFCAPKPIDETPTGAELMWEWVS
jgi:hypothetical protein